MTEQRVPQSHSEKTAVILKMKYIKTKEEHDQIISTAEGRVVVNYSADWCGPCKMITPQLESIDRETEGLQIYKVDSSVSELTQEYEIRGIPAFVVFENGEKINQFSGAQNLGEILKGL